MEIEVHSNDSLDTQVNTYISEGRFHIAILSLFLLDVWVIYLFFYNARVLGFITSLILRKFVKSGYIRIGSISVSAIGGVIMVRDLIYLTDDYSIRCCYGILVFNYWAPFDPGKKDVTTKRRLHIFLYGFDMHVFNRNSLYGGFVLNEGNYSSDGHHSQSQYSVQQEDTLGWIWTKFERLFPVVRFHLEMSKFCFGNHLIPRAFVLTCQKAHGTYTQKHATWQFDKYQHWVSFDFYDFVGSLVPVSKYSGHYAVEEPPQKADTFRVFSLGRGQITYKQDQPGLISAEPGLAQLGENHALAFCTFPEWEMAINVERDFYLAYGPWADRQREMLWKFFFPPTYRPTEVTPAPRVGQFRTTQKFILDISSSTTVQMDLWFVQDKNKSNKFALHGGPDSTFKLLMPWVTTENGSTVEMALSLAGGSLVTDCLWHDLLTSSWLDLRLSVHYPRHWNFLQTWNFDLKGQDAIFSMLYAQKTYFKGFFEDWSSSSRPDILYFVPYIYKFKIFAQPFDLRLMANDYNWVAPTAENALISFCTEKFNFDFDLQFIDFLPATVPIKFDITASSASLCLSIPETSTLLYLIKEMHENLRLAGSNCKPQKNNPFRIIEETLPNPGLSVRDAGKILHKRYWIECWRAPRVHVKIGYTYYPIVWVPDFWRFLPQCWGKHSSKSPSPTEKAHILAPRDPEETALGDLRPEGSKARGPTESELIRSNFDPSYMPADQLDVHVAVPGSQLLFYGPLIRYIIHFKENYFGCYQTPITTEDLKVYGLNEKGDGCLVPPPPISAHGYPGKSDTVVDPREYRPFAVRVTISIHNLQAHLPMHTSLEIPLCPTAFLDCIGFEMDKNFNETKLQLLFSPVLLCVFDKCNAYRPSNASNLSTGRAQLTGFELRGHALFSNRGLPLKADTVEYAWLFEVTCGTLTGQVTAPQLSAIVQSVSNLIFSAIDLENAILSRRSGELCQHALIPSQCSFWSSKSPGAKLCPTELELKYRLFRFNLDGAELAIVEAGTCLMIMLDAVRVARCNMHDVHSRDGISVFLPRVQFLQLIKPLKIASQTLTKEGTLHSSSAKTAPSQPWLEAGSLGFGPVHLHSGISGLDHAYRDAQLVFIRHHDATSHRLWFLWLLHDSVASSDAAVRCGCYGNCAFFGPNASGKMLLDEVLTGVFSRRAVFFSDLNSNASAITNDGSFGHPLTPFNTGTSERSLGVNFGESLFEPDQLIFQLHNSNVCSDTSNGFALMRMDALMADEAAKFETAIPSRICYCSSEEDDGEGEGNEDSSFGALSSSSNEEPQEFKVAGDFWGKGRRKRKKSKSRGNRAHLSTASLETPLVGNEEGALTGDRDDSAAEDLSLTSLLDGSPVGLSSTQVIPPPPPPRQLASDAAGTHVSTGSVPLFTDSPDTPYAQRRGSRSSLQFNHGPSKVSDESTLSGEDFTAKFVDLHGQLNRPITESTLLRTAYERHLNRYIANTELCPPLRLKHRWRVCRRFRDRQQCAAEVERGEDGERLVKARSKCGCRIGIAKAPEFLCSATGFSFRSMVDAVSETTISETTPTSNAHPEGANSAPSSFRISDLRPLLYPHCCDAQICESSAASVSRSSTTVSVLGPVDIFLTPLCTECIDRYITIMAPVLANRSPSSVIDELHFKCILSAGRQGKVLYEQQLKHQNPQGCSDAGSPSSPTLPPPTKRSIFFDQFSENALWFHRIVGDHGSTSAEAQVGHRDRSDSFLHASNMNALDERSSIPIPMGSRKQLPFSDSRHHLAEENNLVGFLSLGRVNIGFMQIYAVEDIVTVDSLSLGLQDLTCVSLLTLAVDMVKIEVLNNRRILHCGMESRELESAPPSFSPDLLSRSLAGERKLSEVQEEHDEDASTAVSPLLSSPLRSETTTLRPDSQSAGPVSPSPREHYADGDVEARLPPPVPVTRSSPSRVVSATEVRHTERLVCKFSISRIHSQLRRLTRESSFTPDVLLTAIPFSASRVFFAFDADQQSRAVTRKSPPAGGLYTGVHGPVPASLFPSLPPPPKPMVPIPSSSEPLLPGHSAGWIMFESGMEELTLLFVQRRGYGDSLEEKSDPRTTDKKLMSTANVYHSQDGNVETEHSTDPNRDTGCSSTLVNAFESKTLKDDADDGNEGIRNAFLMNLHVKTVWLNFPAPKHLPNKRRVEIIRSDWNFLSTVTPTVSAWIGPCNRLASNSKHFISLAEHRTLSVLACLMMEAVNGDKPQTDFRFSSLEDEVFNTYSTLRTPDARRLRYDPSCQIFTTLRRYLQALRKRDGHGSVDARLNEWLRESVLPDKMMLLRGLFLILREWRVAVDVMVLATVPPVISRKLTALLSRKKEHAADGRKAAFSNDPVERRPSGLTLRMFELLTQNPGSSSRTLNPAGDRLQNQEISETVGEVDDIEESDLDDESLINDSRVRCENTILYRFLQDAQHGIRQADSSANILDVTTDSSPNHRGAAFDRLQQAQVNAEPEVAFRLKTNENGKNNQQHRRSPSITSENMNQINHMRGQFRFVDDAQRLFRPLLEAIGVNIKGVRRSTLMKKFGGLFAAEGMLDCFQIEICDSLDNPLQKFKPSPSTSTLVSASKGSYHLRASTLPKVNVGSVSATPRSSTSFSGPSTQRALMCHRFSTKITLRDVVGFGKQDGANSRLGDVELRSTTTKIIADLHVDSISQHSNMPLFRLTHQFVTMFYCARDAQNSAERRRNLIVCKATFDAKDSVTDTGETGSTLKSHPDYVRLSGHSQDSTIDSAANQTFANAGDEGEPSFGSASIPIPGQGSQHLPSSLESSQDPSLGKDVGPSTNHPLQGTGARGKPFGVPPHPTAAGHLSIASANAGAATQSSSIPECWRRMLRYIDLYSTVPETKNVTKRASVMPTILEENDYFCPAMGHKEEAGTHPSGVAVLMGGSTSRFSFMGGRHDTTVDIEAGLGQRHSTTSVSASYDSAAGAKRGDRSVVPSPWFKTSERIPTVVLVTMRVRQMTVSAVLSEVNLTAVVRRIHGSFTKTNRVRGHSLFKERSSNFSFSGHFGDGDVRLTEGIGKFAQEAASTKVDHSHVLLSCLRSSRHGERNACVIGLGHVEITVPHHPVRLHGMVQRQARHLSTTVSEFLQLPNNPIVPSSAGSRKRTCTDGGVTTNAEDFSQRTGAEEHHLLGNDGANGPPLIVNMTAIARGLTVNVSLHPSLNAMYTVDPVHFLGQVGPNGYLDVTVNKHALSFQSLHLPIMFPRSVSLSLPKILAFLARRQSPGGHCILGPSGERIVPHGLSSREGSYLDAQVSVGFFEQRLPSDRLNYIMVVVKLLMKEINEVIRKMAGEQRLWQTDTAAPGGQLHSRSLQQHQQQQAPLRRCSVSMVPPEPILEVPSDPANRFSVSNRFSFRLKFGGILLLAKTFNGAVKFETSEMHVELSNRIGRTHSSWYTDSSSSFSARPHPDLSGSTPPVKKSEKNQPYQDSNSRPQAPSDTLSLTNSESILIYAKIDHLSIELGHLDQDVFYEVWDQEFRTLAFFRTAIALRSLLAEEVSLPTNQQVHRNSLLRTYEEGFSRSSHSRSMPPRTDGDVDASGGSGGCVGGHSNTTSGASSVVFTPVDDACSSGIVPAVGQEAFLVSLRHPIIWAKPSAFDRAILLWMVYDSEFAKWNEHIQQLDALSSEANVTSPRAERNHHRAASAAPPTPAVFPTPMPSRSVASPSLSSPSSADNTSLPKRNQLRDPTLQPPLSVPSGPILFFQLNVEDLGICLPTNILQLSPQSVEVDSRTALVLTLEQSRISACLRGSLVSEGEFTDFCLRFDDDFNVGSDDWKPDKTRSTVTIKKEEHLVIMNACMVPSGTFRVCWKAVEALRAEERGRWLVKIQYQMRGLDVHMDDNIGRRMNALFDILTTVANVDGEQQISGCTDDGGGGGGGGEVETGAGSGNADECSSFRPNLSIDDEADNVFASRTKPPDYPILPIESTNLEIQRRSSQYRRLKWSNLRRKATITSLPRHGLQRTSSLNKDESTRKQANSAVPSPTPTEDDGDLVSAVGSSNACDLSASSQTNSIYFDVEDPISGDHQSAVTGRLVKAPSSLRIDKYPDHKADTYSLQDECLIGGAKVDGDQITSAQGTFRQPPTPPPRKHTSASSVLRVTKQPSFLSPSMREPPRSSLLLELDVNIHVDSGRCGLHPRLPKQEGGGKSIWPTSPAIGSPSSLQDDLYKAYLARYKRQLSQDPLLKPTDISVFYLPALDVGLHYKSHTNYDLWNQQAYRTSMEAPKARQKMSVSEVTLETVSDTQTAATNGAEKVDRVEATTTAEASNCYFDHSSDSSRRLTSDLNATAGVYSDVGRSADLYASVVLQKLPQSLIVHPGLLDFLEQALENLPATLGSESDDGQSTQPKSSVQLNDALVTSTKAFLVDVVVHLCIKPSTIRFLCLPASQMQCLITLPSLNVIFSTERLAEENLKDADGKPTGRLSIAANLADNVLLGDLVSASGLNVTAILNEFRMSVFHPYGGGIGGVLRTSTEAEGTSPGDSLTLKVRDIRLNISRTVQTNVVSQQQQQQQTQSRQSGDPGTLPDVRAATATMTSYVTASSGANSISLHNVVRFSGVIDIGVAEFKCDTRRSLEILHIPKAWYRNSLARALFIGKDSKIPQAVESMDVPGPHRNDDGNAEDDSDVVSEDEAAEGIPRNCTPPPDTAVDDSLANWLQKGPRLRGRTRIGAGTAAVPIKLTDTSERASKRRSATAPREGLAESPTAQTVSNTTTLPPLVPPSCRAPEGGLSSTSRGGGAKVVSWQALPIFYIKIGNLDIRTYMGSAMGRTKLDVRNVFCDGRLYQDSSKRRHGSLGAGVHLCQFTSEQGVVGGEFTLLDLESRIHFKEDPRYDPQHSAELLVRGFQLRIEYMNTNIVFLRINQAEMYLNDEWRLREADHLSVSGMGDEKDGNAKVLASRRFSSPSRGNENTEAVVTVNIGAPPVYVMIAGEINWDQLQVAIARTTTVDLMRSARKVREYFEEQLREGRNSWIGQGDYLLRPDNSSVGVMVDTPSTPADSLSLPTGSGETLEVIGPMAVSAALGFSCTDANVDKLLQRHWQYPMLEAIRACLAHIGTQAPLVRRSLLESTAPPNENSVPPVLGGSLQLAGNSLALACFAGTFRSAPDWAVFNMQHPTICFETEAQREPRHRPMRTGKSSTINKKSVAFACEDPDRLPGSIDEVGGWLNVRQVLSFDLGHQLQYRPQTAYVLRVRRGREQNPVKLPVTTTIAEWLEFMFTAVDITVLSHVRGANPHYVSDVVKLTEFSVDFPAYVSSTSDSLRRRVDAMKTSVSPDRPIAGSSTAGAVVTPRRPNPLKPPTEAEILFVLPSVSMRLTSDQRQSMAHPRVSELLLFSRDLQHEKATAAAEAAKKSKVTATTGPTPPDDEGKESREGQGSSGGDGEEDEESERETAGPSAKVHLSFQTDLHGVIQLGLLDVPWLPFLIKSYISEQTHDTESMTTPDPTYAVTPQTLELAKEGFLPGGHSATVAANAVSTASPIIKDLRGYDVIHWNLSPECRLLLASNIDVPAFDKFLENIGFHRARTTIPKWLQRGVLDHLDSAVAGLVHTSLRLADEQRKDQKKEEKVEQKSREHYPKH